MLERCRRRPRKEKVRTHSRMLEYHPYPQLFDPSILFLSGPAYRHPSCSIHLWRPCPAFTFVFFIIHGYSLYHSLLLCMRTFPSRYQFTSPPRPTPSTIIPASLVCNESIGLRNLYPFTGSMTTLFGLTNFQVVDGGQHDIDFRHGSSTFLRISS